MIVIRRDKYKIKITGHAGYAPIGQDIVCAGISALVQTLIESIETLTSGQIKYVSQPGLVEIKHGDLSADTKLLIDSFFVGVGLIAETYPDNVRIV